MYYTNVTGYLFDNKTSPTAPNPSNECFHQLQVKDVTVYQERQVDSFTRAKAKRGISMLNASFDLLSGGGIMHSVTLRLDGILTTQTTSVGINTSTPTTYYCPQLVVGGDPDDPAYQGSANVPCTSDVQGGGSRLLMLAAVMVALVQTFVM
ncbi:hypothetical protein BS78_K175900 [Paspalum vaginatum]|uniref:Uncharacterized protein n=1 Tax=Paspalum vaginatum TaxID=158149 RepID=A0A9W7X863_9POAL|nr:hypothetical protein BS78_K175900 [Paspalum vaginatum]